MSLATDFSEWWTHYPRKVGKLAAEQAYKRARKLGATQAELLAGVADYIAHKPAYADYAHPRTWLAQGRWMDQWDEPIIKPAKLYWADECQELHGGTCDCQWNHEMRKRDEAKSA